MALLKIKNKLYFLTILKCSEGNFLASIEVSILKDATNFIFGVWLLNFIFKTKYYLLALTIFVAFMIRSTQYHLVDCIGEFIRQ